MNGWWLRGLGLDASSVVEDWSLQWRSGWPAPVLIALAVAGVAAAALLYRREAALGRAGRLLLALARTAAALTLALTLARPMARVTIRQETRPTVLVLADVSNSMDIRDARKDDASLIEAGVTLGRIAGPAADRAGAAAQGAPLLPDVLRAELERVSRRELAQAALRTGPDTVWDALRRQADVKWFRFADGLEETASPQSNAPPGMRTDATRLGDALCEAAARGSGRTIELMAVLTDGASHGGKDPLEAARDLRRAGIPLVTVGVGLPDPDDASLRSLVAPDVAFANDLAPLHVECRSSGYENRETALVARLDGVEVARKTVLLRGGTQFEDLPFRASRGGGARELDVELAALPGEAATENNRLRQPLRILDEKIRVLYVESTPRWEHRYIRAVLKRDPRISVQFVTTEGDKDLARASDEHLGRFPDRPERVFVYDLVILGDVRAAMFTPTQLELLEQLVRDHGGALIALAGYKHMPAEYVDTPLAALLPVRFEQDEWGEVGDDVHPVLTAEGRRSTVMRLHPAEARNQALWSNVKPLYRVPPLLGAKPGAVVLAELSDLSQRSRVFPLIAWHRYGAGKCMFIGADQLWRLRARTGDTYHLKFWGQAVQFLALSRLLGEGRQVRLETTKSGYALGEGVEIRAYVRGELYEPLAAPAFTVHVAPADGGVPAAVPLRAAPGSAGLFQGVYVPPEQGRYRVESGALDEASAGSSRPAGPPSAIEFTVRSESVEGLETGMQRELLTRMAEATGGQYLSLRDLPRLAGSRRPRAEPARYTRDVDLWDNPWLAVLFLACVAGEWAWRRNRNLA